MSEAPPPLRLLLREVGRFPWMRLRAAFGPPVKTGIASTGRTVIVFPGFMASDRTTSRLRRSLHEAGFAVRGWGLGRNRGFRADTLDRVAAQIDRIDSNAPLVLIGWSLGGLVAREYAKRYPDNVAQVITLGTPFSGSPRANNAWRMYEVVARHKIDAPPIEAELSVKPDAHTIAFWSAKDGVVAAGSARGNEGERDRHVELDCTHMAYIGDPHAIRAIIRAVVATG